MVMALASPEKHSNIVENMKNIIDSKDVVRKIILNFSTLETYVIHSTYGMYRKGRYLLRNISVDVLLK